jgi:hypothetical protein
MTSPGVAAARSARTLTGEAKIRTMSAIDKGRAEAEGFRSVNIYRHHFS